LERHGGSLMLERAFDGFLAIAPPNSKKPWRQVFGVKPDWRGDVIALFREKARERHPDAGGNDTLMAELNAAYAQARKALRQQGRAAHARAAGRAATVSTVVLLRAAGGAQCPPIPPCAATRAARGCTPGSRNGAVGTATGTTTHPLGNARSAPADLLQ